jgi:hypothetical protein
MLTLEQPGRVAALLADWLDRLARSQRASFSFQS